MAGHGAIKDDPAIERFNRMREEAYLNFRWTRRTIRTALWGFVIVPGALYFLARAGNARWNWQGKLKGESLSVEASRTQSD